MNSPTLEFVPYLFLQAQQKTRRMLRMGGFFVYWKIFFNYCLSGVKLPG